MEQLQESTQQRDTRIGFDRVEEKCKDQEKLHQKQYKQRKKQKENKF